MSTANIKRSSGILMPISALPSKYGIGTLGKAAYDFVDFLSNANQSWWQILPVGPTSCGDSPYQSFSTYAGNPYFIDLEMLCEDGLLKKSEIEAIDWGCNASKIDYEKIYENRFKLLSLAAERGASINKTDFDKFKNENAHWLCNYALFMALKRHFNMKAWYEWPDEDIRLHKDFAVQKYKAELIDDTLLFEYIQFLFYRQWTVLREYAHSKGIGIIGDLPIYVAMDSSDVWSEPEQFHLDDTRLPVEVAGVPPDYFCEDGQLWGNPLYNWEHMKKDGFGWWIRRIDGAGKLYDILRIDHFRAFASYWAVPYGEKTAKSGHWVEGPGMKLVGVLTSWFNNMKFIAEDLGILTPDVSELLSESGLPGMKVLEFAFDPSAGSDYLPHRYTENCVCYVGTHDNAPVMAWYDDADADELEFAKQYLGLNDEEGINWGIIRGGMSSVASLFIAQMQDYLGLKADSRMNTPGTAFGNWQWRLKKEQISPELTEKIAELTRIYGRSNDAVKKARA